MLKNEFDWDKDYRGNLEWLRFNTILLVKHGSHAYGLNTPTSDLDIKGIVIPPLEYYLGFIKRFEQAESKEPDLVIYDIRKFFELAANCNPNIIEVLWGDDEDILSITIEGIQLRSLRQQFLSKKAKYTFSGYAIAQLKRIKTHKKWLLNPPDHKPTRSEYSLPETTVLAPDQLGAIKSVIGDDWTRKDRFIDIENEVCNQFSSEIMQVYQKERSYHNALTEWHQYQNWITNRNKSRSELEAKYGYDTKHAMHLVRLMRMCREIITTGKVNVKRPDREELLAIRNGAWGYETLIEWAEKQDKENADLLDSSPLPNEPDRNKLSSLCESIIKEWHGISV